MDMWNVNDEYDDGDEWRREAEALEAWIESMMDMDSMEDQA